MKSYMGEKETYMQIPEAMLPFKSQIEQFSGYLSTLKTLSSVREMDMDIVGDFFAQIAEQAGGDREFGKYAAEVFRLNYLNLESEIGSHITTDPGALGAMIQTCFVNCCDAATSSFQGNA